jgi:lipoic acid synthetase
MILGDKCTRSCRFCAVSTGKSFTIDYSEPKNVANAVKLMKLRYCVITSVTRDDLDDGGSEIWAETIIKVKTENPNCKIEVLIPDFQGKLSSLKKVLNAKPNVIAHNLETVKELYKSVRPQADYEQSLWILEQSKKSGFVTKTGIMVGLGETKDQVIELMKDIVNLKCDIFTVGQYLQPTKKHLPVQRYVSPEEFEFYKKKGIELGLRRIMSAPLVRSSYHAIECEDLITP